MSEPDEFVLKSNLRRIAKKVGMKNVEGEAVNAIISELRESYLDLLESTLVGTIYEDDSLSAMGDPDNKFNANLRKHGWDWPSKAFTMIGTLRMKNIRRLIESVLGEGIDGDIVETGVWRGGACIYARGILKAYSVSNRRVFLCDSFDGLPEPDENKYPLDKGLDFHKYRELAVTQEQVEENFRKFGLLDEKLIFKKGWFKDTLPTIETDRIAVLRLDGDLYESTMDALDSLYDKVSIGGWVIVDDYEVVPACKSAVTDFLSSRDYEPDIERIDGVGVCFRKTE